MKRWRLSCTVPIPNIVILFAQPVMVPNEILNGVPVACLIMTPHSSAFARGIGTNSEITGTLTVFPTETGRTSSNLYPRYTFSNK